MYAVMIIITISFWGWFSNYFVDEIFDCIVISSELLISEPSVANRVEFEKKPMIKDRYFLLDFIQIQKLKQKPVYDWFMFLNIKTINWNNCKT